MPSWKSYIRLFPELRRFRDREHAKAVLQEAKREQYSGRLRLGVTAAMSGVGTVLVSWAEPHLGMSWVGKQLLLFSVFSVLMIGGARVVLGLRRHSIRRELRQRLIAEGIPVCLQCGYDLRGQQKARCPECGRTFDAALLRPPELVSDSVDE